VAQNVLDSKHKGKQIWQNPGSLMIRVPWFKKTKKKTNLSVIMGW